MAENVLSVVIFDTITQPSLTSGNRHIDIVPVKTQNAMTGPQGGYDFNFGLGVLKTNKNGIQRASMKYVHGGWHDEMPVKVCYVGLKELKFDANHDGNMEPYIITIPNDIIDASSDRPALLVTPYMRGSTFCYTSFSGSSNNQLKVCHVKPQLVQENNNLSELLYKRAHLSSKIGGNKTLDAWGPTTGSDADNHYRRERGDGVSKKEGLPQSDRSCIVGVKQPGKDWALYAQVIRKFKPLIGSSYYVVEEVWHLYPRRGGPWCAWRRR